MKFLKAYFALLIVFYSLTSFSRTYRVVLQDLPNRIDPAANNINIFNSILLHLYQPLFRVSEDGEFKSNTINLVETKAQDRNFDNFKICLLKNLKFWDGVAVNSENLKQSLERGRRISVVLARIKSVTVASDRCVVVKLRERDLRFFVKLSGTSSSLFYWKNMNDSYPIGTGPYKPLKWSDEIIELSHVNPPLPDFDKIEFIKHTSDLVLQKEIDLDWNHVMMSEVPKIDKNEKAKIQIPLKKTYALIISVRDDRKREAIYKCLRSFDFASILKIEVRVTSGLLPIGVLGNDLAPNQIPKTKLVKCDIKSWPDWIESRTELQSRIQDFIAGNKPLSKIGLKKLDAKAMGKVIFSRTDWIGIIGFDSTNTTDPWSSDPYGYLNAFFEDIGFIAKPLKHVKNLASLALTTDDLKSKSELWRKAHTAIMESFYVVPIGELIKHHYYPKNLRINQWADVASSFPQIDKIELNK